MGSILITGGSGLIGTALTRYLRDAGHQVRHLGRKAGERNGVRTYVWDVARGTVEAGALAGVDRVVHLAGAGIADKRWTKARVKELIDSRSASVLLLLKECLREGHLPKVLVSAAGINYYGALTTEKVFSEDDAPGTDTIGHISREWEAAVDGWRPHTRVVKLRTPVVLSAKGGALEKLAAPVRWGLGAPLGNGRQWMPWVHLDDLVRIYGKALFDDDMQGAYNVNSGHDVTNAEMMRTVASVLDKPFFLPPVPGFLLKVALGDMSSILLEGSRASHERLIAAGYTFTHDRLAGALEDLLIR